MTEEQIKFFLEEYPMLAKYTTSPLPVEIKFMSPEDKEIYEAEEDGFWDRWGDSSPRCIPGNQVKGVTLAKAKSYGWCQALKAGVRLYVPLVQKGTKTS